jgi:hypothetical protein
MKSLRPLIDRGTTHVPVSLRARFSDRCVEAWGARISEALHSTQCDWKLGYQLDSSTLIDFYPAANIVAYCKILEGDLRAEQQDWVGAAQSYLETASFGSDMDQGMFGMNLAGFSSTTLSLEALGRLVGAVNDKTVLSAVWKELSKLDGRMPTLNRGLRLARIWLMARLVAEARAYTGRSHSTLGRIVPWQAVAARRLSRYGSLLSHLEEAVQSTDPAQGQRIAVAIQNDIDRGHGDIVAAELPERWDEFTSEASHLNRLYGAVQVAMRLQEWYLDHGTYPDDVSRFSGPSALPSCDICDPRTVRGTSSLRRTRRPRSSWSDRSLSVTTPASMERIVLRVATMQDMCVRLIERPPSSLYKRSAQPCNIPSDSLE